MEGREAGVASRGQSAQRWKDEKTQTRVNRIFRLTMHSACKTKTEKDRKQHTHTETETRKSQFLNSATGPGFGPKIWHQVWSCSEGPLEYCTGGTRVLDAFPAQAVVDRKDHPYRHKNSDKLNVPDDL